MALLLPPLPELTAWDVFRLTRSGPSWPNFIIKGVQTFLSLNYIFKNTNLNISCDYSEAVRLKRRGLCQFSKTIRKEGDRIRLSFDKLRVNNDVYLWDTTGNRAVRVSESSTE